MRPVVHLSLARMGMAVSSPKKPLGREDMLLDQIKDRYEEANSSSRFRHPAKKIVPRRS
jgi:hypothetical protein